MTTTDERAERGLGVYLEFRGTNDPMHVSQFIVLPEMISPVTGELLQFRFLARVVSTTNPRRMWRPITATGQYTTSSKKSANKTFVKDHSLKDAITAATNLLAGPQGSLDSLATSGWTFYKDPLVIGISDADVAELEKLETPRGLMERLQRLRAANDFNELPNGKA